MNSILRRDGAARRGSSRRKLACERLESRLALAVDLVADLAPLGNSNPHDFLVNNGSTFFVASDRDAGEELWQTNGTSVGTTRVSDIYSGIYGSYPRELTNVGNNLFFRARTAAAGYELWTSDGTSGGTKIVSDVQSGTGSSTPSNLTAVGNKLFFVADDGTNGNELWQSNGTAAGTTLVKDIRSGSKGAYPKYLTNINGTLYFTAFDDTNGYELWKSDGTAAGTTLVKDIRPGTSSSAPRNMIAVGSTLYFRAFDDANGYELWKSNGTAAGTTLVKDIRAGTTGSYPGYLTNVNGKLFFQANDGTTGTELWTSDGTTAGTKLVNDINTGAPGSYPGYLANVNNKLFFTAYSSTAGYELWTSNGTTAGTIQVKDIQSGAAGSYPRNVVDVGGIAFFSAADGAQGYELWRSDGTTDGTTIVKDIFSGGYSSYPFYLTNAGGQLFFRANDGVTGYELFKSDGTQSGTVLVRDLRDISGSYPRYLTDLNGTTIFSANSGGIGLELWKSDGTLNGTTLLKDIRPGGVSSSPSYLTKSGSNVFFRATDKTGGSELWKTDGTSAGTLRVTDLRTGLYGSYPKYLTDVAGTLFFVAKGTNADDTVSGYELWKTDGTDAGTVLVKDINAGTSGSYPSLLTNVNGTLYFTAYTSSSGYELWKSNGTAAGTVKVSEIGAGTVGAYLSELTNVNGTLFFRAYQSGSGYEIWKSNGTTAGTVLVKDIRPTVVYNSTTYESSFPTELTNVNGTLFFRAYTYETGYELWKSDGSAAGTVLVRDINSTITTGTSTANSYPTYLTEVGGKLYFRAYTTAAGYELWTSNGTSAGTVLVRDIYTGSTSGTTNSSYPAALTSFQGKLYFQATTATGAELWQSDGTSVGTTQVKDIRGGATGSVPLYVTPTSKRLFFTADDGIVARELWSIGDTVGTVSFASATSSFTEGATQSVTVKLTTGGDVLNTALTVIIVATSGTASASDYSLPLGTVTFPTGSANGATMTLLLSAPQDFVAEGNEAFSLTMQSVAGTGQIDFAHYQQAITIIDDDQATVSVVQSGALSVTEAGSKATFTIALTSLPTADVIVSLSSSDATQGSVSPTSLVFTKTNGMTPQTVTITGVDDLVVDGNRVFSIVTAKAVSTDVKYNNLDIADVSVTNVDNDQAAVVVTQSGTLSVSETGTKATFTIALASLPTADVTIGLSSSDTTQGTVSPVSLVFTKTNGMTPQTVTVTGVNDFVVDGNHAFNIVTAKAVSTDTKYNNLDVADVPVTNVDNDLAAVAITQSGALTVTEAGSIASFTIALSSLPTADVTISLSSSDTTQGTVSPANVVFTKTNGMTPQTVTITGANDFIVDGNHTFNIVTAKTASADSKYNNLDVVDVPVTNTDNDQASVVITQSGPLTVTEAGSKATFSIALTSLPTADVTIGLSSSDTTQGAVSPASLVFTKANGMTPQIVTITGMDDLTVDGNHAFNIITAKAISTDPKYNNLEVADVSVINIDNDQPGVVVTQTGSLSVDEKGTKATFTIALTLLPLQDVTIALTSTDLNQGTVSPAILTFTKLNGLTAQTVTVTGVDDQYVDGVRTFSIVTAATVSLQAAYNGLVVDDITVTSLDNGSRPYQNPVDHLDANDSKSVSVVDALVILNDISRRKQRTLPNVKAAGDLFYDTNGDGKCSVLDALVVLNGISKLPKASGEVPAMQSLAAPVGESIAYGDKAKHLDELLELLALDHVYGAA